MKFIKQKPGSIACDIAPARGIDYCDISQVIEVAYRPAHGIANTARYSGLGNRPPDPHDLISRHAGSEEQRMKAWRAHIEALLSEAIKHEADAIREYDYLLNEIKIIPADLNTRARLSEIIEHIKREEINHIGLLRRLKG